MAKRRAEEDMATWAERAQDAIAAGNWRQAEAGLRRMIAGLPPQASLHYNLGLVLKQQDKLEAARESFDSALELDPKHAKARFEAAAARMDLGALPEAYDGFAVYLTTVPDDADALLNAARLALRLGRLPEAAQHAARLETLAPQDPVVTLLLAELAAERGELEAAKRGFAAVLRNGPPELRAAALSAMTQRPRGGFPLSVRRLGEPGDQPER